MTGRLSTLVALVLLAASLVCASTSSQAQCVTADNFNVLSVGSGCVIVTGAGSAVLMSGDGSITNLGSVSHSGGASTSYTLIITGNGSITNTGLAQGFADITHTARVLTIIHDGTLINSGSVNVNAGSAVGLGMDGSGSAFNSGTISATGYQIAQSVIIGSGQISNTGTAIATTTSGCCSQARALQVYGDGNISNTGSAIAISSVLGGFGLAVSASISGNGNITNTGSAIATTGLSGTSIALQLGGSGTITNSGRAVATAGAGGTAYAVSFGAGNSTLVVGPGSFMIGDIVFNGANNALIMNAANQNLTVNSLSGVTVTGAAPFVAAGNQIVSFDPTLFAAGSRTLTDFTRAATDSVPVFSGGAATGGGAPLAFAGSEGASRIIDAFAALPGLSAYSGEAMAFKAPTQTYADGTTIWARGFGGQRMVQQDGVLARNTSVFYGGMIGGDFVLRPDLRYGFYLGGGKTTTSIDLNLGGGNSDLVFGGAYARYDIGQSFVHGALQIGTSHNATTRTINNNLLPAGLETATASYDGWYVSPEATFGHRYALGQLAGATYTLTPSLRIRYLYGSYGGYTETGTTAPLTVGSQTVSTLEERGELKLTRSVSFTPSDLLSASISGGVLGTQRVGANAINAALLGQAIPFATPGQSNTWGGFGGLGLEWRTRNVTLFSAAEYLAFSDNANVVSGRAGVRVAF